MKPLIGVFLAVVSVSVSRGQLLCDFQGKDSVVAIVTGDTIVVWDIAACAYCSAEFSFSITSSADSIYITQTDTAGRLATCECIFDLRTSLSGLSGGRYWIVLYRDLLKQYGYPSDTHQLIKSVQVDYQPNGSPGVLWSAYQSECNPSSVPLNSRVEPNEFALSQNYPNPFNPGATLRFHVSRLEFVEIKLFDELGHDIQTLWSTETQPGSYTLIFEMNHQRSSGIYYCRMTVGTSSQTIKMVLLR